jgi:iron complex outermembrane receptor protein
MKIFSRIILLLLLSSAGLQAQNITGTIRGTITTNDGQPAAYVSVQIKDKNRGAVTDNKGEFVFRKMQPGHYTIEVSLIGYTSDEQRVEVKGGQTSTVVLQLKLSDTQLNEVSVIGVKNKLGSKESDYIARLPLKNIENPQVYNVVGQQLMKEQAVVNFDQAIKNVPGVSRLWSSTGRPEDGAGYFSIRGFAVQPTMINGIAGLTNGGIDPANIERIEVIKGPSGTLFGSSLVSFGGLMNIVTKKPYESFGGELSYMGGSFGLSRVTADINTPLTKDNSVLLRVNGAYSYEGSFQDAGFKKSVFLAPSLAYKATDRLSFLVNTEIYTAESTNALMVFLNRGRQLIARTPAELGIDFNRSFTNNDITYKTPVINVYGQMNYKLSNKWTSQTSISRGTSKSNGYYSYVMFLDQGPAGSLPPNDTLLSRYAYHQNSTSVTTDIQQNFIGDFKIGQLRNRLVAGLDFLSMQVDNNNSPYLLFDYVNAVNIKDPRYGLLNRPAVDKNIANATEYFTNNSSKRYTYSAYVSDVLNITDRLLAMASLRVDHYDNKGTVDHLDGSSYGDFSQTTVSPKFGLVYELIKNKMSVFANYMNGFQNVAPVTQPLGINGNFKPQQANQFEGGIKLDALNHLLNFTASYYNILVSNMTRGASIEKDGVTYNYTIQDGSQRSKGIELDLTANPIQGLTVVAGYGYNDSKMEKADSDVNGRRPTSAGPAHLANLWLSYTTSGGKLKGFGAGIGGNYASENMITNSLATGIFTLPAYTVLNATIFYNVKQFRLGLNVDNFTNKEYFGGWTTVEKQMPRRIIASAAFKF